MTSAFLVIVALMMGFVAAIWSGKGLWNIGMKLAYTVVTVWAAGLAIVSLGWPA